MAPSRLIVCERTPRWLALWRCTLPETRWSCLSPVLSFTQCEGELKSAPGSVAAVAVDLENLAVALQHLHRWTREFPAARFLALCSADVASEPASLALLREAGALLTIEHPDQLASATRLVARIVKRHLREQPATPMPLRETVWQQLPWGKWAVQATAPQS